MIIYIHIVEDHSSCSDEENVIDELIMEGQERLKEWEANYKKNNNTSNDNNR